LNFYLWKRSNDVKLSLAHIGNSAGDFGERVRTTIFSVVLRRFFEGEKNWGWSFALNFVSFVQAKERRENR
jgi:hypothetical protein